MGNWSAISLKSESQKLKQERRLYNIPCASDKVVNVDNITIANRAAKI